jgi:hypothetical protein
VAPKLGAPKLGSLPPAPGRESDATLARRRRGRNIATLVILLALAALFYAIAMVKMAQTGHPPT